MLARTAWCHFSLLVDQELVNNSHLVEALLKPHIKLKA